MVNWIKSVQFSSSFTESGSFSGTMIEFYHIICVMFVPIIFLIGYWIFFIVNNHSLKRKISINKFNLNFILRNKTNFRYFFNRDLSDRKFNYLYLYDIKDFPELEGSWCLLPLGFVSTAAYPSIGLEYGISPDTTPLVVLKVIANQWYWVFELEAKASPGLMEGNDNFFFFNSDMNKLFIETYGDAAAFYKGLDDLEFQELSKTCEVNLKNEEESSFFRLLEVDNKVILPVNTPIKLVITSADVLHSFAVPAWGVKIDAIPGRLSEQVILIDKPGLYWGQCSELCGPYHGFMPVVFEVSSYPVFLKQFF